jgi:hypothetical protein
VQHASNGGQPNAANAYEMYMHARSQEFHCQPTLE